jgi:predicted PurR-regulated permease PerM
MPDKPQPNTSARIVSPVAPSGPWQSAPLPPGGRLTDFARRMVVAVLVTLLILTVAYVVWTGIHILLFAFAGMLFAIFLVALSDALSTHTGISYHWSLTLIILGLALLAAGLGWLLFDRLSSQIGELIQKIPQSLGQIRDYIAQYPWGRYLIGEVPKAANSLVQVNRFSQLTGFISGVADFVIAIVVILVIGIFGAIEPDVYKDGLLHLVPPRQRPRTHQALDALAFNLRWWLVGQVALMIIMGISTMLGLWGLGIPLALALGIIAGVLEIIPYIGPWLSFVPSVLMALLVSPWHALMVAGLYLGLHVLEGYVLVPFIQRKVVLLPPALTLITQMLLGYLLGFWGLFVAAPLTVCGVVLLKMLYVEDTLGDETVNVPGEPGSQPNEARSAAG